MVAAGGDAAVPNRLTATTLGEYAAQLAARDPDLAAIHKQLGPPPLCGRPPTFATLVRIILEQQVSLASARGTFERFREALGGRVTVAAVRAAEANVFRASGFSRQKTRYTQQLADNIGRRRFSLGRLQVLANDEVRLALTSQVGLGPWSADVYLLLALKRADIFPVGDLALRKGMEEVSGSRLATPQQAEARAEAWRPYRSVATRMIWQAYLHRRGASLQDQL